MSLKILTNTAYSKCSRVLTTTTAGVESSTADQLEMQKLTGGPFHFYHLASVNEDRKFLYVNPANTLSADWLIMPNVSAYVGTTNIKAFKYSTWPGTATSMFSGAPFSETLIGPNSKDFITAVSASAVDALELEVTQATTRPAKLPLDKIYFCTDYTLLYPGPCTYSLLPINSVYTLEKRAWPVVKKWTFTAVGLTRAEVQSLTQLPYFQTDLFFIYEPQGGLISFKLLPCVLDSFSFQAVYDNLFNLSLSVYEVEMFQ